MQEAPLELNNPFLISINRLLLWSISTENSDLITSMEDLQLPEELRVFRSVIYNAVAREELPDVFRFFLNLASQFDHLSMNLNL